MQRWTGEQLRLAVAANRNMSQTLSALGLRPLGANYDTVRRRIAALRLDTSHWGTSRWRATPEQFRAAVAESDSVASCLQRLGWPVTGACRMRFKTLQRQLDVDTSHFLGQASHRGKRYPHRVRPVNDYLRRGGPRIGTSELRHKLIAEGVFEPECAMCRGKTWLGQPIPLDLDHINGDREDNRLENLRLLCPNCHALIPTYRGRNMGRYDLTA
jgi:hypothetical protein